MVAVDDTGNEVLLVDNTFVVLEDDKTVEEIPLIKVIIILIKIIFWL